VKNLSLLLALVCLGASVEARADWLQPDMSYREAQLWLRAAIRDTMNHSDDPVRLDSLGISLLRLGRFDDAEGVLKRSLAIEPDGFVARSALGKIALFRNREAEAESLLATASFSDPGALADLFAARVRLGHYEAAADLCDDLNATGRIELLQRMAQGDAYGMRPLKGATTIHWKRADPVPVVPVKLNGQRVLMAIDTGTADLIVDDAAVRRHDVQTFSSRRSIFWTGSTVAARNAMVQSLEIGDATLTNVPAAQVSLGKWSLEVNPKGQRIAGIIGLNLLRRFTPTIDYKRQVLVLRPAGEPLQFDDAALRVPFETWGESELMVYGTMSGGRRMAFVVQTGVPGCGIGAPRVVLEEIGVKPGMLSKAAGGIGGWLQGVPWAQTTVPTVTVGPVVKDKVKAWQNAMADLEMWRHGVRRDALLSHDFFKGMRVSIDWSRHELVFED
jgi:hypothetical protein